MGLSYSNIFSWPSGVGLAGRRRRGLPITPRTATLANAARGPKKALVLDAGAGRQGGKPDGVDVQQVVGHNTFQPIPIAERETNPKSGALGPGGKGAVLPPGLPSLKIANKTNQFCFGEGDPNQAALG